MVLEPLSVVCLVEPAHLSDTFQKVKALQLLFPHLDRYIAFEFSNLLLIVFKMYKKQIQNTQTKLMSLNSHPHTCPCVGTLTSITNLATSLARNMDRLSFDEEYYMRQEEWRRQLPETLGHGLRQGLSCLGLSLLGQSPSR